VNVGSEAGLPNNWHKIANAKKKEACAMIQLQLHGSSALGLPEPIVTMELTSIIISLQFALPYEEDLEAGLQSFVAASHSQCMSNASMVSMTCFKVELPPS
jgi:hypothetical protein